MLVKIKKDNQTLATSDCILCWEASTLMFVADNYNAMCNEITLSHKLKVV